MKLDDLFEKMADSEDAKENFTTAEKAARLPRSGAANFMQIVGGLGVVVGILSMRESFLLGLTVILSSGFIFAAAGLQQSVYDIRTMLLRDRYGSSPGADE